MDINVYKTLSGEIVYKNQKEISDIFKNTHPGSTVLISIYGSIRVGNAKASALGNLRNEKEATQYLQMTLGNWNSQVSISKKLNELGVPPIFPKELKLKSSSTYIGEDGGSVYDMYFDIKKKPSSREKAVIVLNAGMQAKVNAAGDILYVQLDWKPVIQKKIVNRLPLRISPDIYRKIKHLKHIPEVRYHFNLERQFIVPLYRLMYKDQANYFPATSYFV